MPEARTGSLANTVQPRSVATRLAAVLRPDRLGADIWAALVMLARHRRLIVAMALRELRTRYAGQIAGSFWIIGHPLFQLLLFVFVFGIVFSQKMGGTVELPRGYATYILSGLIPWLTMNPVFTACCLSVISNANLVTQFAFESELLPVKDVAITLVFWCVGITTLSIYSLVTEGSLPITYLLLPLVLLLHVLLMVGIGWLLAAVSVFLRDVKDFAVVLVTAGVYILPIVYLPSWVPPIFRPLIVLNPFSAVIWVYQDTLYFGRFEHPKAWFVFAFIALLAFGFGHRVFQRLKPHFGAAL
jgi:lipopolysaccharide transport system permease protein